MDDSAIGMRFAAGEADERECSNEWIMYMHYVCNNVKSVTIAMIPKSEQVPLCAKDAKAAESHAPSKDQYHSYQRTIRSSI